MIFTLFWLPGLNFLPEFTLISTFLPQLTALIGQVFSGAPSKAGGSETKSLKYVAVDTQRIEPDEATNLSSIILPIIGRGDSCLNR